MRTFDRVRAYVVELGIAPPIMCSCGFDPEEDFNGHEM
jgi:hypothetical protein